MSIATHSATLDPAGPAPALPWPARRLRATLLEWYDRHKRTLPWRAASGERADPYAVLVSEIMLQQTTVATVLPRFSRFMRRFPTVTDLAAAPLDDVLHEWAGLGYYRRARGLHACAQLIAARHAGRVPGDLAALQALPGFGPYTAAAVGAIAFNLPAVPVDGNVERVLSRLCAVETPLPQGKRTITALASTLAGELRSGDFAQALMELGALICTPRGPLCLTCPWQPPCRARAEGRELAFPVKAARASRPSRHAIAFLLRRPDGTLLMRRRAPDGLLGGMIDLPASDWDRAQPIVPTAAAMLDKAPLPATLTLQPGEVRHVFTHFALHLQLALGQVAQETKTPEACFWVAPSELALLALPTLTRKLLQHGEAVAGSGKTKTATAA